MPEFNATVIPLVVVHMCGPADVQGAVMKSEHDEEAMPSKLS